MMAAWVVSYFVLVISVVNLECFASEDADRQRDINDPQPFRLNKLNMMWEKAKETLDESKLPALYAEFVLHDRREIDFKKRSLEGTDPDGEEEALIRHKFLDILSRFDLRSEYSGHSFQGSERSSERNLGDDDNVLKTALSRDPKLEKLWKKAEQAGFTDEEMAILKAEFGHHAEKLDEYEQMRDEIERLEKLENSVSQHIQETDDSVTEKLDVQKKHMALKKVYKGLKESYKSLKMMTEQQQLLKPKQLSFVDGRVRELWKMAQQANMTEDELLSLRTELEHFERRINKHEFFEKEAEISRAELQLKKKYKNHELPETHLKLESKAKGLGAKVKKWYSELKSKILKTSPHSDEL